MAALVAGVPFRPSGDWTADVRGLAGVGLGLETLQQDKPTPRLLLTAAGPSHEKAVAIAKGRWPAGEIGNCHEK